MKNNDEKLISKIIKEVVKIFSIVIAIILVVHLAFYIYYAYINKFFIIRTTCSMYGVNYKYAKIEKKHYCCIKTEENDYKKCIEIIDYK